MGWTDGQWPAFRALSGWRPADFTGDAAAALMLAAIAIPEQMATARLGGFSPALGFWVFVAGSLAFAVLGASRVLSVGADSTITPIFAGGLAALGALGGPHTLALASLLALLVGALVLASGLLRLGWVANLLSVPVTTGFLLGIAVHIALSQLPTLLGLDLPHAGAVATLGAIVTHWGSINLFALALGVLVFGATLLSEAIDTRIPGAIIGMALATLAVVFFGLEAHGVQVLGRLPSAIPQFRWPAVAPAEIVALLPLVFIVTLVVLIQTSATVRSFSGRGGATDVNRDFVGVGAGNLVAGFLGGFPVNASPPRTAVVAESGGRSALTGMIAALLVGLVAAFGSNVLAHVPAAALAGLLLFVAQRIVRAATIRTVYRQSKAEFALIAATAFAIVALPIATGVGIGIALSLLNGAWTITRSQAVAFERVPGTTIWWPPMAERRGETVPGVAVIGFQAPLFFLNAGQFVRGIAAIAVGNKLVVLEASSIVEIDFSAAQLLLELIARLREKGITLYIARLESVRARESLHRFGIDALLGEDHIFLSVEDAVRAWAKSGSAGDTPPPF